MKEDWFETFGRKKGSLTTLYGFPHAGAGALMYSRWALQQHPHLQVVGLRFPGRERLIGVEPIVAMDELVKELLGLFCRRDLRNYALFGQCSGALLALALCRALHREDAPLPSCLFVSGQVAPRAFTIDNDICSVSDAELVDRVRTWGLTDDRLLANEEFLHLILPVLRADITLLASIRYRKERPLPIPIWVLKPRGEESMNCEETLGWMEETEANFCLDVIPGERVFELPEGLILDRLWAAMRVRAAAPT